MAAAAEALPLHPHTFPQLFTHKSVDEIQFSAEPMRFDDIIEGRYYYLTGFNGSYKRLLIVYVFEKTDDTVLFMIAWNRNTLSQDVSEWSEDEEGFKIRKDVINNKDSIVKFYNFYGNGIIIENEHIMVPDVDDGIEPPEGIRMRSDYIRRFGRWLNLNGKLMFGGAKRKSRKHQHRRVSRKHRHRTTRRRSTKH